MEEAWKEVRYGRTRQRTYDPGWGRVRGMQRGKDSAPPVPLPARAQFPVPNQRVPPPLLSRNVGVQAHTYADVLRQDNPRPAMRSDLQRKETADKVRKQPADPEFGQLVRKMHAVIKIVHHLQNVAVKPDKPEPRMISRMGNVLSTMIKPASPTTRTMDLIWGNANNWGYNTLLILEDHYKMELDKVLEELSKLMVRDWEPAFQVATRWARRNLPHVAQDAIDHAEALIASRGQLERETDVQHQPPVTKDPPVSQPLLPQQPRASQGGETPQTPSPQPTASRVEKPLRPERDLAPREKTRVASRGETKSCVITEDSRLLAMEEEIPQVENRQGAGWSPLLFDIDIDTSGDENTQASTILTPIAVAPNAAQEDKTVQRETVLVQHNGNIVADSYQQETTHNQTFTPSPQLRRATRHINTGRKRVDWRLPSTGAQLERGRRQNRAFRLRS